MKNNVVSDDGDLKYCDVSVIIPSFNSSLSIERAILSVINQTLLPGEVIVVDDCSSDIVETLQVIHRISGEYKFLSIKCIQLSVNNGPGNARNIGWERAQFDFIAFLDSDDSWHPKKLELQYKIMLSNPQASISAHLTKKINTGEIVTIDEDSLIFHEINHIKLLFKNTIPTRTVMLNKNIIYRFDNKKRYSEDYLLWLDILFSKNVGIFLNLPLAFSYKEDFGENGLNGNLIKSEIGELNTFLVAYFRGYISIYILFITYIWSLMKFFRRLLIHTIRLI